MVCALDKDDRPTPQALFDELHSEFEFTLDVAASKANAKCPEFYTADDDGLQQPWHGTVWCNPPYSEIRPWLDKAVSESVNGVTSVFLLPSATDTKWFHEVVLPYAEIRFLPGRLKFEGQKQNAPFASLLAIFRPRS